MKKDKLQDEIEKCRKSPAYFMNNYVKFVDKQGNEIKMKEFTDEEIMKHLYCPFKSRNRRRG